MKGEGRVPGAERALEVAVVAAALATLPVVVVQELGIRTPAILVADWTIWAIFALELVIGLALAARRGEERPLRSRWLSLAIVVLTFPALPALLQTLRLVRLARFARLPRAIRAMRVLRVVLVEARALRSLGAVFGRRGFVYVLATAVLLIVSGGALMAVIEPGTVRGGFWSGVWWAIVTVSTVGYGDIAPRTPEGRMVAVFLILVGIGVVGTLAASVAAYFVGQDEADRLRALEERLERIEGLLRKERPVAGDADDAPPSLGEAGEVR